MCPGPKDPRASRCAPAPGDAVSSCRHRPQNPEASLLINSTEPLASARADEIQPPQQLLRAEQRELGRALPLGLQGRGGGRAEGLEQDGAEDGGSAQPAGSEPSAAGARGSHGCRWPRRDGWGAQARLLCSFTGLRDRADGSAQGDAAPKGSAGESSSCRGFSPATGSLVSLGGSHRGGEREPGGVMSPGCARAAPSQGEAESLRRSCPTGQLLQLLLS